MNTGGNTGLRQVGTGFPTEQLTQASTGRPGTVEHFALAETYAVQWVDQEGRSHKELLHRIGGVWFKAPNGENYAATLRPITASGKLSQALEEARTAAQKKAAPIEIPKVDVDVTGDGG